MSNAVAPIHAALMQTLLLLVLLWILPHVARQEFLFGVFVGVSRDRLRVTPTIFRIWHAGMAVMTVLILASCVGLSAAGWRFSNFRFARHPSPRSTDAWISGSRDCWAISSKC